MYISFFIKKDEETQKMLQGLLANSSINPMGLPFDPKLLGQLLSGTENVDDIEQELHGMLFGSSEEEEPEEEEFFDYKDYTTDEIELEEVLDHGNVSITPEPLQVSFHSKVTFF